MYTQLSARPGGRRPPSGGDAPLLSVPGSKVTWRGPGVEGRGRLSSDRAGPHGSEPGGGPGGGRLWIPAAAAAAAAAWRRNCSRDSR